MYIFRKGNILGREWGDSILFTFLAGEGVGQVQLYKMRTNLVFLYSLTHALYAPSNVYYIFLCDNNNNKGYLYCAATIIIYFTAHYKMTCIQEIQTENTLLQEMT